MSVTRGGFEVVQTQWRTFARKSGARVAKIASDRVVASFTSVVDSHGTASSPISFPATRPMGA